MIDMWLGEAEGAVRNYLGLAGPSRKAAIGASSFGMSNIPASIL
jgi:hypothetical protein